MSAQLLNHVEFSSTGLGNTAIRLLLFREAALHNPQPEGVPQLCIQAGDAGIAFRAQTSTAVPTPKELSKAHTKAATEIPIHCSQHPCSACVRPPHACMQGGRVAGIAMACRSQTSPVIPTPQSLLCSEGPLPQLIQRCCTQYSSSVCMHAGRDAGIAMPYRGQSSPIVLTPLKSGLCSGASLPKLP